jgi:cytochrome c oxidase subunit 4
VKIAIALAIITLLEVGVYYVDFLRPALVPLLIVFSLIKFALVVLWFMHLRFDSRLFMRLFVAGVILAVSLFVAAFGLFFGG